MKMKNKVLSAAVLAAMGVGSAQAVNLSQDGTGEVLIFPYYTVNSGHKTLLSIVNTKNEFKAVKIRFREGVNSRESLDFNLYLSPYDVWTGGVVPTTAEDKGGEGGAKIVTGDTSCTVPAIPEGGQPFKELAYADPDGDGTTATGNPYDGGGSDASRGREGYFEFIEMGMEPAPGPVWGKHAKHGTDSIPSSCATLVANWTGDEALWNETPNAGMTAPSGGLFGAASVINVATGTELAIEPTVLDAFTNRPIHAYPGQSQPTLASVRPAVSVTLLNDGTDDGLRVYLDDWSFSNGIDAVSALLMARTVMNQFTVNPDVQAETSWVVTFPTKFAYADNQDGSGGIWNAQTQNWEGRDARAPFTNDMLDTAGTVQDDRGRSGMACERVSRSYEDREEQSPLYEAEGPDFSPLPIIVEQGYTLCNEVNVINFGESDVFGSSLATPFDLDDGFDSGWATLSFLMPPDGAGHAGHNLVEPLQNSTYDPATGETFTSSYTRHAYRGLPVIGFAATRRGNANVGVGAAYDNADAHKYERQITQLGIDWELTNAWNAGPNGATNPSYGFADITNGGTLLHTSYDPKDQGTHTPVDASDPKVATQWVDLVRYQVSDPSNKGQGWPVVVNDEIVGYEMNYKDVSSSAYYFDQSNYLSGE